jgi:hypothetical protein
MDKISFGLDMVPPFFKWNISSSLRSQPVNHEFAADNTRYQNAKRTMLIIRLNTIPFFSIQIIFDDENRADF